MDAIYQPAVPDRWADPQAIAKLSPSDPIRTLTALHASIQPLVQAIEDARAKIDSDATLSPQGKLEAKQQVFAEHVGGTISKHSQPLRLTALRVGEQRAALLKSAVEKSTVSEGRMLAVAGWLRDLAPDVRSRVVLGAIDDGDGEVMAAVLAAPRVWSVVTPLQREKAQEALMQLADPERAAVLRDTKILLQAVAESHESLARHGRKALNIGMAPAKAA